LVAVVAINGTLAELFTSRMALATPLCAGPINGDDLVLLDQALGHVHGF